MIRECQRSTRVRLKITTEVKGPTEHLACDGETHVVNLQKGFNAQPR
jgi:hypothetical protein